MKYLEKLCAELTALGVPAKLADVKALGAVKAKFAVQVGPHITYADTMRELIGWLEGVRTGVELARSTQPQA